MRVFFNAWVRMQIWKIIRHLIGSNEVLSKRKEDTGLPPLSNNCVHVVEGNTVYYRIAIVKIAANRSSGNSF